MSLQCFFSLFSPNIFAQIWCVICHKKITEKARYHSRGCWRNSKEKMESAGKENNGQSCFGSNGRRRKITFASSRRGSGTNWIGNERNSGILTFFFSKKSVEFEAKKWPLLTFDILHVNTKCRDCKNKIIIWLTIAASKTKLISDQKLFYIKCMIINIKWTREQFFSKRNCVHLWELNCW